MDAQIRLYRKRFIPNEIRELKDDKLLYYDDDIVITSWDSFRPRPDLARGLSVYYRKEGYKISRLYGEDGSFVRWYCDIIFETVNGNEIIFSDLLVDVVLWPDGKVHVVDLDEAADASIITSISKSEKVMSLPFTVSCTMSQYQRVKDKGLPLQQEANELLKQTDVINYVGNVEGRDLMFGDIDVMVCDGFTGNIAMKSVEGCGKTISTIMKREYKKNLWRLICAIMSKGIIKSIKGSMDYEKIGGAMFLGLNKAVVKGHGNSKASAFAICIAQAAKAARGGLVDKIKVMIDDANAKLAAKAAEAEETAEA